MADSTIEGLEAGKVALEKFFAPVAAVTPPPQPPKPVVPVPDEGRKNDRRPRPPRKPRKNGSAWRWDP